MGFLSLDGGEICVVLSTKIKSQRERVNQYIMIRFFKMFSFYFDFKKSFPFYFIICLLRFF